MGSSAVARGFPLSAVLRIPVGIRLL